MKYDFTSIIDRHGKDAIAVDGLVPGGHGPQPPKEGFDIIPMWVADMNFPTVPTITQAIAQRIQHPFFGYFATTRRLLQRHHPLAGAAQRRHRPDQRVHRL